MATFYLQIGRHDGAGGTAVCKTVHASDAECPKRRIGSHLCLHSFGIRKSKFRMFCKLGLCKNRWLLNQLCYACLRWGIISCLKWVVRSSWSRGSAVNLIYLPMQHHPFTKSLIQMEAAESYRLQLITVNFN